EAVAAYQTVMDRHATAAVAVDAARRLARLLRSADRADDADALYARCIETAATPTAAAGWLLERGRLARERGKSADAVRWLTDAEKAAAADVRLEVRQQLVEALYDAKDYAAVAKRAAVLTSDLAALPADDATRRRLTPLVDYRAALLAYRSGRSSDAADALGRFTAARPDHPLAPAAAYWRGEAAYDAGRTDDAVAALSAVLADPKASRYHPNARLRRAQAYLDLKKGAKAAEDAAALVAGKGKEIDPAVVAEARMVEGRVHLQQARFREARTAFAAAFGDEKTETAARAQFYIGESFFHQEQFDEALKAYLKVDILYPYPKWQALALLEAGKCYERSNEDEAARKNYRRLLDRFADQPAAAQARDRLAALGK
ncbi:MAG: tetratricopeptide repeat protein, partial [Planctomycetia bacterium]